MKRSGAALIGKFLLCCSASIAGCQMANPHASNLPTPTEFPPPRTSLASPSLPQEPPIQQVALAVPSQENVIVRSSVLTVDELVQQVLARNPSVAQMTAAWQAASARYPQVTSLDDPVVSGTVGPASVGSNEVDFAYRVEVSQKLPFPGKRGLKGSASLAEAAAAENDVEATRLQLIEGAKSAFYEYFRVDRALEVSEENLKRLREARQNAETRFKNLQAPQQDILQADVEIGRQQERELTLRRMREVAVARLNTLMHLPPDNELPPPPAQLAHGDALPDAPALRAFALSRRPDLQALAARIDAEQAMLELAYKEYCPDFEVMAAYDAFWQSPEKDLRPQLAVRMNVPVRKSRREGAIAEAQARVAQRVAERDRLQDEVNYQVQEALAQVRESEGAIRLYDKTILPAAEANVKEARTAYATAKIPFVSLVEAQRTLVNLRERYYETVADYHRRRATLERGVGGEFTPVK